MTDPNAARPGTAYCPCGGTCHHADHPCSLGCWAAQKPWRVEEAQQATAARLAAAEARVEALATCIHHDSLCRLHGLTGSCDCGLSAVLSRLDAAPARPTQQDALDPALAIVKRTAGMGMCSQTHHEHLMRDAREVLRAAAPESEGSTRS